MKRIFMKITALALTLALFLSFTGIFASAREKLPFANSQFLSRATTESTTVCLRRREK